MLFRITHLVLVAVGIAALAGGCGWNNGLPYDLMGHLARHGISVRVLGSDAPLRSRAGFVFFNQDPDIEAKIIAEFDLRKIEPNNSAFNVIPALVTGKPKTLWGIGGRPAKLKLKGGAQFEYLYLLTTEDGRTYLLACYAYG